MERLVKFLAGLADDATAEQVAAELRDPASDLSQFLARIDDTPTILGLFCDQLLRQDVTTEGPSRPMNERASEAIGDGKDLSDLRTISERPAEGRARRDSHEYRAPGHDESGSPLVSLADIHGAPLIAKGKRKYVAVLAIAASLLIATTVWIVTTRISERRVVAQVADAGRSILLYSNNSVGGLEASPDISKLTAEALRTGRLATNPDVAKWLDGSKLFRGQESENLGRWFTGPIDQVLEDRRPVFTWKPADGASEYRVTVLSDSGDEAALSLWLNDTRWKPANELSPGKAYEWQIEAKGRTLEVTAPPLGVPRPSFFIIDEESQQRLRRLRAMNPPSHVALAVEYAHDGLLVQAQDELKILQLLNPHSSTVHSLQASLNELTPGGRQDSKD